SALIIRSHVKDGLELGRKHRLPEPILDMIPQHHGTSVIEFFFDKACKEAKETGEDPDEVDSSLYSYPGPKPQTREAGILMLADGIEAAARTLSEPSRDRIQGMVQKMINKVFSSGQLNECDLTLNDLHLIAKSFTRILTSIYHQRIAYNEPVEKGVPRSSSEGTPASSPDTPKEGDAPSAAPEGNREKKAKEKGQGEKEGSNGAHKVDSGSSEQSSQESDSEKTDSPEDKENLKRLGI
ncbi:MAG: HD domain-containing protein, partial [Bdellovibrionales bacterium]|nr:HD domain-containing protein [Bdellovibrionales bacterium]